MVLIKPSLFPVSDLITALSFASAEILSSETFVSLIVIIAIVLIHCPVLDSTQPFGNWRKHYDLGPRENNVGYIRAPLFPLFCPVFLLLLSSLFLLLSLSSSLSFLATGSGGGGDFSTCHDIPLCQIHGPNETFYSFRLTITGILSQQLEANKIIKVSVTLWYSRCFATFVS